MAFGKKKKKEQPGINTASLPDIVFMLLFFFMVATVTRESSPMVKIEQPKAKSITIVEDRSKVSSIYIGPAIDQGQYGSASRIQIGGQILPDATVVRTLIDKERGEKVEEFEKSLYTVSLKVDIETDMFVVDQVKQNLREIDARKILYSTKRRTDD